MWETWPQRSGESPEDIPRDTKDVSLPLDNALQGGKRRTAGESSDFSRATFIRHLISEGVLCTVRVVKVEGHATNIMRNGQVRSVLKVWYDLADGAADHVRRMQEG